MAALSANPAQRSRVVREIARCVQALARLEVLEAGAAAPGTASAVGHAEARAGRGAELARVRTGLAIRLSRLADRLLRLDAAAARLLGRYPQAAPAGGTHSADVVRERRRGKHLRLVK